ncbi:hypothetical protein Tco_0681789 [Tanacetum coccineum]|uniref:Uncharacterized protein n=1 Tax=Tanacetum coccineum TaxID=301880 RepID=A0ABQ4XQX9_9ASTR
MTLDEIGRGGLGPYSWLLSWYMVAVSGWTVLIKNVIPHKLPNFVSTRLYGGGSWGLVLLSELMPEPCLEFSKSDETSWEGGEEFVNKFRTRIIHVSIDRGGFLISSHIPGCPSRGKREKHKLNRRIWYVRNLHRRSDLVEISDVGMWVFFIVSKKLLVLNKIQKTMLDLKVICGGFQRESTIASPRITLGGASSNCDHVRFSAIANLAEEYQEGSQGNPSLPFVLFSSQPLKGVSGCMIANLACQVHKWEVGKVKGINGKGLGRDGSG